MNYMSKVAELLGVELGERFRISEGGRIDNQFEYWFNNCGIQYETVNGMGEADEDMLRQVLCGGLEIVKKPWTPKDGDTYYSVGADGKIFEGEFDERYVSDIVMLAFGNCFRTGADAEAHKDEIIAKIREALDLHRKYGPERTK